MTVKKSSLEKKWQYRLAKVLFWALPLLIILLLLIGKIPICIVPEKGILESLKENIVWVAVGLALYFLVLGVSWRLFFYVVYGGVEDDMKKTDVRSAHVDQPELNKSQRIRAAEIVPIVIIIVIFLILLLSQAGYITLPKINLDDSGFGGGLSGPVCHQTSAEWGLPCGSSSDGGPAVAGLPIPVDCPCPIDTEYSGTTDVITPGGPYQICVCR